MAKRLCCVTYTDEQSACQSALTDFTIGLETRMVGCNLAAFSGLNKGDWVLIQAKQSKQRPNKLLVVGQIDEVIDNHDVGDVNVWKDKGGHEWKYNCRFTPLTHSIECTEDVIKTLKEWCTQHELTYSVLVCSRFCNKKYLPVVQEMVSKWGVSVM